VKRSLYGFFALWALAPAGAAGAQTAVTLSKPDAELADPFTQLRSMRELPNGKVLVSDLQDKLVALVDFAAGSSTKVGRQGQGPGEYAFPTDLVGLPNGQTLLNDMLNRRYLIIEPDGKTSGTIPLPSLGSGGGMVIGLQGGGSDASGRIYITPPPFNMNNPGGEQPDSIPVLRWDRVKAMDTVGWVGVPKGTVASSGSGGRFSVRIGDNKIYSPQEAWGVAGDGSVARVVPSPYRVVWYGPNGSPSAGPPIAYTPIKVTEQDKKEEIENRRRARPQLIAIGGSGRAVNPPNVKIPDPEFEETKPPFTGPTAVVVSPEGEAWVLRTRPAGDRVPTYDVFDRTGRITRKVSLNPRSRVLGFGKGTVYVIRTDEDDLQYLQRYRR